MDFEKLDVWKLSARLSADLYSELKDLRDFGFRDQVTRSGLSIPSNIAEGMSRETGKEKVRFLSIAKGSCSEVRTQIYIGMDINYIDKEVGKDWIEKTRRIASMLSGLMNKLRAEG